MSRITLEENENVLLQSEYTEGNYFIHCDVKKWSPSIAKDFFRTWSEVLEDFENQGVKHLYTVLPADDEKALKFNNMYGFLPFLKNDEYVVMEMEV